MGTFGSAAVSLEEEGGEEEEKKRREVEHLPPLLEDEENVSLADVLCLRDAGLSEQELWSVCVECVCSLQSISFSPLFQSLCVTPDTLAFNAHGNVCFMEQLNDDPEGCFIPPEFEKTGSTIEGHVFSLGSTLSAALDYVTDVDLQLELSEESRALLKQMQKDTPEERPTLQVLHSEARALLGDVSSTTVCRKLSAIGRRVLSIESVAAFQDGPDKWSVQFMDYKASRSNSVETHSSERRLQRNPSSEWCECEDLLLRRRALLWRPGGSVCVREDESSPDSSRSQNSSPVHRKSQEKRPGRALNRSCSVPDSNNPPAPGAPTHTHISMLVADLSEISAEEQGWRLDTHTHRDGISSSAMRDPDSHDEESAVPSVDENLCRSENDAEEEDQSGQSLMEDGETHTHTDQRRATHINKTMLCLNEETQSEWISLRDLLCGSTRPFSVNELWALCYTCLSTLQTYIDLPDYLCLDSVYVGCEGEVLFLRPKNSVSCDAFFLAPEFQEHGIVTEKVCVYGVAAVLWATAKFHLSPSQKLSMPRRLKRLLLEMAKRTPIERPSIQTAKKCCREYLSRQGTTAESVWTQIISRVHQAFDGNRDTEESAESPSAPHLGNIPTGFVPLSSAGRLEPVVGPVPHHYPESSSSVRLPEAFTSAATHFSPIILSQTHTPMVTGDFIEDVTVEEQDAEHYGIHEQVSANADSYSSSSSCKTLIYSPQTTSTETHNHSLPCANGICQNFPLQTGHLTQLPVQSATLQPITAVDLSAEKASERADLGSVNQRNSDLQDVIQLLRGQFPFDGDQDLAMGQYISSLKSLQFEVFCGAVMEKYSSVCWDQKLLCVLHRLLNQHCSPPVSDKQPSSKPVKSASVSLQSSRRQPFNQTNVHLDHNANFYTADRPKPHENNIEKQQKHTLDERRDPEHTCRGDTQQMTSQDSREVSPAQMDRRCSECPAGGAAAAADLENSSGSLPTPDGSELLDMEECECVFCCCSHTHRAPHTSSWALALYGDACFSQDVREYEQTLCSHCESPTLEDKTQELQQQLIIETRNLKKTRTFYHKLIQQERKNKGSDSKLMVSKVKLQFDELRAKVEFLQTVKKYLQVLCVDQWGLALSLLPSVAAGGSAPLDLQHSEDPAILQLLGEPHRGNGCPLLSATARGLMAYLYARNAHSDGFIQQFFYTYRYFCTPDELLHFLMDKLNSTLGASADPSSDSTKVYQRTLDLLQFWITDAQLVDFSSHSCLQHTLDAFLTSEVAPVDSRAETLLLMLQDSPRKRRVCGQSCDLSISSPEDEESLLSVQPLCRRSSTQEPARNGKDQCFSMAAALPRPCFSSLMSGSLRSEDRLPLSQTEHTAAHIAQQLTLLEQEIFQDCHPVHFLNSRAQGVAENAGNISRCVSVDSGSSGVCVSCVSPLQTLLLHSGCVSTWVSAELVICDSVKAQAALLSRFLAIGKHCYETRNFATAMQILSGLENVIVRQLPAWKQLPLKVCEILEELKAVQVFLKSDALCLMEGQKSRCRPTLPDTHILSLHTQQTEIGAFSRTSGALKWNKLRNIARVVSQVQAFQERVYPYPPDSELQSYLRARILHFGRCDVTLLASKNHTHSLQTSDRHARRIQDTLRRVKASFQ